MAIGQNVGRFQQFFMAETTDCAVRLIGSDDALAEGLLVKPSLNLSCHIPTASVRFGVLNARCVA